MRETLTHLDGLLIREQILQCFIICFDRHLKDAFNVNVFKTTLRKFLHLPNELWNKDEDNRQESFWVEVFLIACFCFHKMLIQRMLELGGKSANRYL